MAQFARPASDQAAGNWTPTPVSPATLFDKVDEAVADDADYISSPVNPVAEAVVLKFSAVTDPQASDGHIFRYRLRKSAAGGQQIDATVELVEDVDGTETVIATWTHSNHDNTWTTYAQTLSTAQADAITDYADLYIRVTADAP